LQHILYINASGNLVLVPGFTLWQPFCSERRVYAFREIEKMKLFNLVKRVAVDEALLVAVIAVIAAVGSWISHEWVALSGKLT
jgi:hypothetical protein